MCTVYVGVVFFGRTFDFFAFVDDGLPCLYDTIGYDDDDLWFSDVLLTVNTDVDWG